MPTWDRLGRALRHPDELLRVVRRRLSKGSRHGLVGRPDLWQAKRQFQIEFLRSQDLAPEHRLLDIGCGTLRGGIVLIDYLEAGNYTGVEVRPEALDEGRRELAESGLGWKQPRLIRSDDLASLALEQKFDYIWAYSVLIHMTDGILDSCVGLAARHLQPDGVFLANVNIGEEGQPAQWGEFPVVRHPREFYAEIAQRYGLALEDLGPLHELGDAEETPLEPESRRMLRLRHATSAR